MLGDQLLRWTAAGYDLTRARPDGPVMVLTPPSLVEVLHRGWDGAVPLLHPTAETLVAG